MYSLLIHTAERRLCTFLLRSSKQPPIIFYIKNQLDAALAVLFISHCKITLHVSDAFCLRNM